MSDRLPMRVDVDTSEAKSELDGLDAEAEATEEKVNEINERAKVQTELTYMKAVQTTQQTVEIVNQAVGLMGDAVSDSVRSTIALTGQAIAVIAPLLTAQTISGWMAIQATLGLISLGQSIAARVKLEHEAKYAKSDFDTISMDLGGVNY